MLEIRPAGLADHERIVELLHQGWHEAHAGLVPSEVLPNQGPLCNLAEDGARRILRRDG